MSRSGMLDKSEVAILGLPSTTSHGGSDINIGADGAVAAASGVSEPQRTRTALEHLQQKILRVTEEICVEQKAHEDDVAEYIKLVHIADKEQAFRIKPVFEKKNQKSAQTITHLRKKLERYHKKLMDIEQNGPARQPKDVLRDMQQGLKDEGANVSAGISGFGGGVVEGVKGGVSAFTHTAVVSKPREFDCLIKNKFGSAENIAHLKETLEDGVGGHAAAVVSKPTMGSPRLDGHHQHHHCHIMQSSRDSLLEGLQEIKASQGHMEDAIEDMKGQLQNDCSYMTQCLQEERYRYDRLEEHLNDLTELHQNEMTNLQQELASMQEKVAYQSYERARDVQEAVESCLTRITKLELQQQQQVVQLEGVENANARALLGKLINVVLMVIAVLLVFVSTLANFITPLMKTQARVAATFLLPLLVFILWKHWDLVESWLLPS